MTEAVSQWQPIETAPRDGTVVLGYGEMEDWDDVFLLAWNPNDNIWYDAGNGDWGDWFKPTHWCAIPATPAAPQGETNE